MERIRILLPDDLVRQIDVVVEADSRDAVIMETAREALRRQKLLGFLKKSETAPAWKAEDHPELANGSAAWVRKLRQENEGRLQRVEKAREGTQYSASSGNDVGYGPRCTRQYGDPSLRSG